MSALAAVHGRVRLAADVPEIVSSNLKRVTFVPPTPEPFQKYETHCRLSLTPSHGASMFSLKETADGKFIYRCHSCDSETELMALDQMMAADQAVAYSQTHKCTAAAPAAEKSPKAS